MKLKRINKFVFPILMSISVAGCFERRLIKDSEEVDFQHDAASFTLAVTTVKSWKEYAELLSPKFTISGDSAVNKVIPVTSSIEQLSVSKGSIDAKFGLPINSYTKTSGISENKNTVNDGKTTTITESSTSSHSKDKNRSPGIIPENSASVFSESDLPATSKSNIAAVDPLLQYSAATALYQEIQLLNRYVKDVALRRDYEPYIVRLQLGVLPYKRDMPYDTYITLSFFPKSISKMGVAVYNPAIGIPLLVTDSLEGARSTQLDEMTQQVGFAIGALAGNVVGQLGTNKLYQNSNRFMGTDINSTFTIGRIIDGAVQIRLGAIRNSTNSYAMVPRNHHITMLVLVPKEVLKDSNGALNKVEVRGYTELRHAEGKYDPKHRKRFDEFESIYEKLKRRYPSLDSKIVKSNKSKKILVCSNEISKLQDYVVSGDFIGFSKDLSPCEESINFSLREAWLIFAEELNRREFIGANFEIPPLNKFELPKKKSLILLDSKKDIKVSLYDGSELNEDYLKGVINYEWVEKSKNGSAVSKKKYTSLLPATSVNVSKDRTSVEMTFPSPQLYGIENWSIIDVEISGREGEYSNIEPKTKQYKGFKQVAIHKQKPKEAQYKLNISSSTLTIDGSGNGSVKIHITSNKKNGVTPVDDVVFQIKDAEVYDAIAFDKAGKAMKKPMISFGKVVGKINTTIELKIRNVAINGQVTLSSFGRKGNTKSSIPHPDLNFNSASVKNK